jgi:uncharacterized protein (TIGR03086 family)
MSRSSTSLPGRDPSIEHLLVAGREFARIVASLSEHAWRMSTTPCARWDVQILVAHTLSIAEALVPLARGNEPPRQVRTDELHGPRHTGDRLALAVERGARALESEALDEERNLPWGRSPARLLLDFSTVELVVHGWDLAAATGVAIAMPDATIEAAARTVASSLLLAAPDGDFGTPVAVPPGLPVLDQLAAVLGRVPKSGILESRWADGSPTAGDGGQPCGTRSTSSS